MDLASHVNDMTLNENCNHNQSSTKQTRKKPLAAAKQQKARIASEDQETPGHKFTPYDDSTAPTITSGLPPELWLLVQSCPGNFAPEYFLDTSRNLLENPNLTASHLARAELSYQSFADETFNPKANTPEDLASIVKHLRPECRPQLVAGGVEGYSLEWTVVRKLIPRNPKLDDSLMQTCHLYRSQEDITITSASAERETVRAERNIVIYVPHATDPDSIPYYHPKVRSLAMLYTYIPEHVSTPSLPAPGLLQIFYNAFPSYPIDNRLSRTALKLLEIIHKHSRGTSGGYKKRVHHDQILSQKTFQDTYAYLKGKYAKDLIDRWVEQTPPEKHVFEDLGIAAFLIELWVDMYASNSPNAEDVTASSRRFSAQSHFPGFVDIGCGNGLLVYILISEGWPGWGFDARHRKTWATFPPSCASKLKELLLVPAVLNPSISETEPPLLNAPPSHSGIFPASTFIISNHADELTPWTPLLAYLSRSPFLAIPCCSHDLGGTRFRAPVHAKYLPPDPGAKSKNPSAYASLCSWVSTLAEVVGYSVEREYLRIPSTRNIAILGRAGGAIEDGGTDDRERTQFVMEIVEREMGGATTIEQVARMWMKSGGGLLKPGKDGH